MKKIHFAIMMLLMSIALMTEAQTNKELPKSLFYVNPKAKPFIERVYAKFPKQSGFSVSKSISHYYTAFAGNPGTYGHTLRVGAQRMERNAQQHSGQKTQCE
jgi:hypothetical protein